VKRFSFKHAVEPRWHTGGPLEHAGVFFHKVVYPANDVNTQRISTNSTLQIFKEFKREIHDFLKRKLLYTFMLQVSGICSSHCRAVIFWISTPCCLVGGYQYFGGTYYPHL
jgi:hypothetical protein